METLASVKTEANIAIIQKAFEDFSKGNIPGIIDACTDDVLWRSYENPSVPFAQTYKGKQGVAQFFANLSESMEYTAFEPKEFYADKDRVFTKGYHAAKVRSTGKEFGHEFILEFQLRNSKVCYFFSAVDSRDQAAAFGSSSLEQQSIEMHDYFSKGQFDKILERAADDVLVDAVGLDTLFNGKQGLSDFMGLYKRAFPDVVLKHTNIFSSGNQVAVEFIASGTHTGPLSTPGGEIPATGRSISVKVFECHVWKDGKIQTIRNYVNTASIMMQLGLM